MATWAYECHPADKPNAPCFVACASVDAMPAGTRIVRLKIGSDWLCGVVDRGHRVEVEAMLLREVVASDAVDCPECAKRESRPDGSGPYVNQPPLVEAGSIRPDRSRQVQAAAISMHGQRLVVVLVDVALANSPGEADMAIADFQSHFGVDIVLMGQYEDGTPQYYGNAQLVEWLADLPVDRMPWKSYPLG